MKADKLALFLGAAIVIYLAASNQDQLAYSLRRMVESLVGLVDNVLGIRR